MERELVQEDINFEMLQSTELSATILTLTERLNIAEARLVVDYRSWKRL